MSIYITGDTHSDFRRFRPYIFNEQLGFSGNPEDNYMIICGDFGGIWYSKDYEETQEYLPEENDRLVKLNSYPWTTLFVDGNHDNFDRLYSYPVDDWHGGKVHRIKPNIIHLMRGESYLIEDKRFFCFGGASSHDIQDGIIDPVEDTDWIQTA